jgi:hypothetical protein
MKSILLALTTTALLVAPTWAASDCAALQTEVEQLRARVKALEAAQTHLAPPVDAAPVLPGAAAKPAAVATVVVEEPYSRTGCSKGLFKGIEPARWQETDLWLDLEKGQSPAAVEKLLGVEHYDERGGDKVIWHYGKCGASSMAQVLFTKGLLSDWRAPTSR